MELCEGGSMLLGFTTLGSLCCGAVLALTPAAPSTPSIGAHVRGVTPAINVLLADGARRSPTLARLMRELEATNVIVYVETTDLLPAGLDGRLTFMTSAGGFRYLRVQVTNRAGLDALLAMTGHELQHAAEVAAHPEVRDSADLEGLYRRIGNQGSVRDRYDTAEARSIGRRVRAELS
jgi:hypothetical protein